jgi:hypothetical protein
MAGKAVDSSATDASAVHADPTFALWVGGNLL